jgi:hypothetical protein
MAAVVREIHVDDREESMKAKLCFTAMFIFVTLARASSFYSISGDPNTFIPDQFSTVDSNTMTVSTVGTLGNGSLGFNGGLTVAPGGIYAVANDSTGASSFYNVQQNGSISLIGSTGGLGFGFLGGLAFDSADSTFYAAVQDTFGNSSLYSITSAGVATALGQALGTGYSGLAYDSGNGLFYGIGNDGTGFSTLYDFSLGGPVNIVGGLGFGFGALTYDTASDVFWAISPVNNTGSQLFQITAAGAESSALMTLGDGFVELAAVAAPEPGSFSQVCLAALIVAGFGRFLKKKSPIKA